MRAELVDDLLDVLKLLRGEIGVVEQPVEFLAVFVLGAHESHGAVYKAEHFTEGNIKAFESTAKKYGIDFALKKDATESPPRYLVFFKGRDADVLTAAFKEFSAKKLTQEKKPSIRKLLSTLKEAAQGKNAERAKVKNKDREVSL